MNVFMDQALLQAQKAYKKGEVPIGAVVVKNNKVIAKAYNNRERSQIATNHAEVIAINKACKKLKSWRLDGCDLYVTLKPCPMCAGAIVNARINNVYYGAESTNDDENLCETILQNTIRLNHKTNLIYLKNQDCENILKTFFLNKRQSKQR